jgi:hypothetical protein
MKTWWRSIVGIVAGGANLFANGTNWKQVLLSMGLAGIGVVSQFSSTSDVTSPTGKIPGPNTHRIA